MAAKRRGVKYDERFGFDYLNKCVLDVLTFEDLPADRLTVTTARLLSILDGERERRRRVERWNREKNKPGDR